MNYTKIKHNKGEVELAWKEERDNGETLEHRLNSYDHPRPELDAALSAFAAYVVDVCNLPADYSENMTITGVTLNFSESLGPGLVVTALKKVSGANSPVVINTPFLSEAPSCDGGPKWPGYLTTMVSTLEAEADAYRTGRRAQQELALGVSE